MINTFCALSNNNDKKLNFLSKFNHIIFHENYESISRTFCVNDIARKLLNTPERIILYRLVAMHKQNFKEELLCPLNHWIIQMKL